MTDIDPSRIEVTVETAAIHRLLNDLKLAMVAKLDDYFIELESRIIHGITVRDNDNNGERLGYTITVHREDRHEVDKFGSLS